jgi:hypothetical protein
MRVRVTASRDHAIRSFAAATMRAVEAMAGSTAFVFLLRSWIMRPSRKGGDAHGDAREEYKAETGGVLGAEAGEQEGGEGRSESERQSDAAGGNCERRSAVLACGGEIEFGADEEEEEHNANVADYFEWMQAGGRKDECRE